MSGIIIKQGLPKNKRPWWHISHRLLRNPFDPQPIVQHLEWCRYCKMDVDIQVEAANADGVDVYRKRCNRCGKVMQWGMGRREMTKENSKPLPVKAMQFIRESGKDRR